MHSDSLNSLTTDILSNMCSEEMKHKSKSALDMLKKILYNYIIKKNSFRLALLLGFQNQIFFTEEPHETT